MKRREFLTSSVAALPLAFAKTPFSLINSPLFNALGADTSDRVLVLINLIGGNDGLNTFIPLDQYSTLAGLRSNVLLPQNQLIGLTDTLAMHPSMAPLRDLWDGGRMNIIQDVGYPDQNRSHFRSTDIWQTASASNEVLTSGWLGRYFDMQHPGFPNGYPNEQNPHPISISIGNVPNETCQGMVSSFALTVNDPLQGSSVLDNGGSTPPANFYGDELSFVRNTIHQANVYGEVVRLSATAGQNAVEYPSDSRLAGQLRTVARLISGGLQTKVYVVSLGGFDTHGNQVVDGNPLEGVHAGLLNDLAKGVAAFFEDLRAQNLSRRVLAMTYSEFGRRIRSNDSLGTDHGTAAPAMIFGDCVTAGVQGSNAYIDPGVDAQEGVAMQFDFRDMYGSVLQNWFGLDPIHVRGLLYDGYQNLPIISGCDSSSTQTVVASGLSPELEVWPSPFRDNVQIKFKLHQAGEVKLSIFDQMGSEIETLFSRRLPAGEQVVSVHAESWPVGPVIVHLRQGAHVKLRRALKI